MRDEHLQATQPISPCMHLRLHASACAFRLSCFTEGTFFWHLNSKALRRLYSLCLQWLCASSGPAA